MDAIETKYHGPTNTRGSRVSARMLCEPHEGRHVPRVTRSWDYGASNGTAMCEARANHGLALAAFLARCAERFPDAVWLDPRDWRAGETPRGYVWVYVR